MNKCPTCEQRRVPQYDIELKCAESAVREWKEMAERLSRKEPMETNNDGTAAKRLREVLLYCKMWTEGDIETLHLRPERKVLEHRIRLMSEAIQIFDALPPNDQAHLTPDIGGGSKKGQLK